MRVQRRYMTLMEIMLVLGLIMLVGGVVALNVRSAIQDQRFRSDVEIVADQIRLAQEVMLVLKEDVTLDFFISKDDRDWRVRQKFDTLLPELWDKEIRREKRVGVIKTMTLKTSQNEELLPASEERVKLYFMSNGSVMSQGILRMTSRHSDDVKFICLPGYATKIEVLDQEPTVSECDSQWTKDFGEALTRDTFRLVPEKKTTTKQVVPDEKT